MGWDGYNRFGRSVTADIVEAEARALVSTGMKAAGYRYVILDGGWNLRERNSAGSLVPDPAKFPRGVKPVADYVHSLGLKFGIYASAGFYNCAWGSAGSYGHYQQDARTFASWGVDYVKLDWCNIPYWNYPGWPQWQVSRYLAAQMSYALAATRRPIVLDVNDWTGDGPWNWAAPLASLWRVCDDIQDSYFSMVSNFSTDIRYSSSAGPGAFNDPDMLEVGNGGMTATEYQAEFSLWAMLAAPLIAGNDLTSMTTTNRNILSNREVIAVDQDRLGREATVLSSGGGHWVLVKSLADGSRAVVFFDQANAPASMSAWVSLLGLKGTVHVLDLWTGKSFGENSRVAAYVPAHGVVMYRIWA
jgi:alpha-galactosidase